MHAIMRRWIVWCVLCLLPWRLWATDAMALRACHDQAAASAVAAVDDGRHHHRHRQAAAPSPVADDVAPHAQHGNPTPPAHGSSLAIHLGCTLCDLCHNPLSATLPASWNTLAIDQAWPVLQLSAPPQTARMPELRPPIA